MNTGKSHSISNEWEGVADAGGWPGAPVEEEIEGTINLESELPLLFSQPADGDHVDDDGDGDLYIIGRLCLSVTKNDHFLLGISYNHM